MAIRLVRGMVAAGSVVAVLAGLLAGTTPASAASAVNPASGPRHPNDDYMGSTIPAAEKASAPRIASRAQVNAQAAAPDGTPGVDVSNHQGAFDWNAAAAGGAKFGYMKATEGNYFVDPQFSRNFDAAAAAGLKRGAYHFGTPNDSSGTDQANYFLAHGGGWAADGVTLPPVLDIEYNPYSTTSDWTGWCYNETPAQINAWITDFVNRMHDATNRWPVIYTTSGWWNHCTAQNTTINTNTPLWIAPVQSDAGQPAPAMPAGWDHYTFYQWGQTGNPAIDQDVFAGTTDALAALAAGSTQDKIADHYAALGGANSFLGAPSGSEYSVAGGWGQNYAGGAIYYFPATGAFSVHGAILAKLQQLGGPAGVLGFPLNDESGTPDGVGRYNHFTNNASVYWTAQTDAHAIYGLIRQKWADTGWENGPLGYPATDENGTPDGVGRYNHFTKNGSVYYTPSTGAHAIYGLIRQKWADTGWESGPLGYPATDEMGTPDGVGRYNHFTKNGSVYFTTSTGAHAIYGAIRDRWAALGWERSYLGYPSSDEYAITNGRRNDFQGGYIYYTVATGAVDHPW